MNSWYDFILDVSHQVLWLSWVLYWFISARNVKKTVRRETFSERLLYAVPLALALILFSRPMVAPYLGRHIWPQSFATFWLGTMMLAAGLLFSVWARRVLGRNWSGTVTVKEDHELIQTGPYRWVRHPIYTGLLAAVAGSATSLDRWSGFLGLSLIFLSFYLKLLREEAWMREVFGEKYDAYARRTARLIPGVL